METKRNAIIKATLKVIKEKGYGNITVMDICKKAHIARSTFYYQFKSLDEVLHACFKSDFYTNKDISSKLNELNNPLERLFFFHEYNLNTLTENGIELSHFHFTDELMRQIPTKTHLGYLSSTHFIVDYIQEAQNKQLILNSTPAEVLAETITIAMTGCVYKWLRNNGSYDLKKDTFRILKTIYIIPDEISANI